MAGITGSVVAPVNGAIVEQQETTQQVQRRTAIKAANDVMDSFVEEQKLKDQIKAIRASRDVNVTTLQGIGPHVTLGRTSVPGLALSGSVTAGQLSEIFSDNVARKNLVKARIADQSKIDAGVMHTDGEDDNFDA